MYKAKVQIQKKTIKKKGDSRVSTGAGAHQVPPEMLTNPQLSDCDWYLDLYHGKM